MSSLKVICPKCFKGQQIAGAVPTAGLDHVCIFCKTTFRVRPPARPSSDDLPVPRELQPKPDDLPAAREAIPKPTDLPAPREAIPRAGDLPAPREAIPKPGDLPVPREAIPKPGDLPVPREAIPKPGDLPVPREAIPKPGDLPVSRDAVPKPGDLPVPRDAVPKPGDLPVPRDAVPKLGDLPVPRESILRPGSLPATQAQAPSFRPAPPERAPTKTPPLGLALDLSFGPESPAGSQPLSLDLPPIPPPAVQARPPAIQSKPPAAPAKPPAPPPKAPVPPPKPPAPPAGPPAFGVPPLPSAEKKPPPSPPKPPAVPVVPAGVAPSIPRSGTIPLPSLASLELDAPPMEPVLAQEPPRPSPSDAIDLDLGPARTPLPARTRGAGEGAGKGLDLGFSLELEGDAQAHSAGPAALPFRSARVASEGMAESAASAGDELPTLAPPTARGASAGRAMRPVAKKAGIPKWILFAGGGLVLAAVAVGVGLPLLRTAPSPDTVLKPFAAEINNDSAPAYAKAAEALIAAAADYKESGARLRLRAAELLLTGQVAHGVNPTELTKVEQLIDGASGQAKLAAAAGRARALLSIAKRKPKEADALLVDRGAAENQRIVGMARLAEDKPAAAADAFRRYLSGWPMDVLAHYLLARASFGIAPAIARKEFEAVLAQNPRHVGAKVGLARLEETAEKRLAAGQALAEQKSPVAGSLELAELQLLIGLANQELGRTPEAIDAFRRAITLDRRLVEAPLSLGECLLYEGKYKEALEQLQAAGPALQATPAGKFTLGGAQIANGRVDQGLALVSAGAKDRPEDPRGPFWQAVAASVKNPPDLGATEQGYRDAIKRDPKFLPASLRLAAFLQQQDKADDSLAVLRAAEEAGAPPSVLQLAWGEALIVAKEPAKAQAVFEKAAKADPKSISARLGIAAALEAQDKLAESKAVLEAALKEAPATLGLRERLAQVALKSGDKAEALSRYQEEIAAGQPRTALRLAVARLAIELGKIELAQSEAKKVLDEAPRSAEAAYVMARVHEARGESGAALAEYRHATSWGNTPQFALSYGQLLTKIGKVNEALAVYADAVSLPEGRLQRGKLSFRAGDVEGALADFQAATKMNPAEPEALVLQGLCFDKMGQATKAEDAWRAALRIDPESPEPHYRLGRMELDRGKPSAAIEHFRKAMAKAPEKAPWRADLFFQLAQAELLTGAKPAALADFKKYLEIAPPNAPARPEANEQVKRLGGGPKTKLGSGM